MDLEERVFLFGTPDFELTEIDWSGAVEELVVLAERARLRVDRASVDDFASAFAGLSTAVGNVPAAPGAITAVNLDGDGAEGEIRCSLVLMHEPLTGVEVSRNRLPLLRLELEDGLQGDELPPQTSSVDASIFSLIEST